MPYLSIYRSYFQQNDKVINIVCGLILLIIGIMMATGTLSYLLAMLSYSVYSVPTTYFIDKDGYVAAQANGAIDPETLKKGMDMIR